MGGGGGLGIVNSVEIAQETSLMKLDKIKIKGKVDSLELVKEL